MALTIIDIARLSGTSKSTVSRYLNHGSVSEKSAKKIQKVIEETNFNLNAAASQLKKKRSFLVGVLVNFESFGSTSVAEVLRGIDTGLRDQNYKSFITLDKSDNVDTIQNINFLLSQGIDGMLLTINSLSSPEIISFLEKIKIPTIVLGQPSKLFPYRDTDNIGAGKTLANYISSRDKKNILYLGLSTDIAAITNDRLQGLQSDSSLNIDFIKGSDLDDVVSKVDKFLNTHPTLPDAIVGSTDRIAFVIQEHLIKQGYKIPDDLGIAGFGNSPYTTLVSPNLTTVDINFYKVGYQSAVDIVDEIQGKKVAKFNNDFGNTLLKRNSL